MFITYYLVDLPVHVYVKEYLYLNNVSFCISPSGRQPDIIPVQHIHGYHKTQNQHYKQTHKHLFLYLKPICYSWHLNIVTYVPQNLFCSILKITKNSRVQRAKQTLYCHKGDTQRLNHLGSSHIRYFNHKEDLCSIFSHFCILQLYTEFLNVYNVFFSI